MPTLHWLSREEDLKAATQAPYRLLEHVETHGDPATVNMLIQGDNLDGLKALLPYYAGKVKCVYIDPPFNTQQAFDHYDDGIEHSLWISIMYSRLEIIRDLLSLDGSLFVHIDDNEIGYIISVLDEIIGRQNRIGIITFKQSSASGPKAINPGLVTTNNYILYYAREKAIWDPNKVYVPTVRDKRYSKFIINFEEPYEMWRLIQLKDAFLRANKLSSWDEARRKFLDKIENNLLKFVLDNAKRVVRTARVAPKDVNESAREALEASIENSNIVQRSQRAEKDDYFFLNGEQLIFYKSKTKTIDGTLSTASPLTNLWDDLLSNNLHNEGGVSFPNGKKPESLIKRCLELSTNSNDLVLDSFLGSGTTAAVAHKMGRRYIGIEIGEHSVTHCIPRLQRVVAGEQGGISKAVGWHGGGGFRFYRLGEPIFDAEGNVAPQIRFPQLAAHIWFSETKTPWIGKGDSALLGVDGGTAYYLLYNGILGDKRANGGNVLTSKVLEALPPNAGPKVIYGERTTLSPGRLKEVDITFKFTPYDIKGR